MSIGEASNGDPLAALHESCTRKMNVFGVCPADDPRLAVCRCRRSHTQAPETEEQVEGHDDWGETEGKDGYVDAGDRVSTAGTEDWSREATGG